MTYVSLIKKPLMKNSVTASTICWAALTIGTVFTKNFSQLVVVRVLLGAVGTCPTPISENHELRIRIEAAIIPCIFMYITMTYNRDEYALRTTYVFSASAISGAFGMPSRSPRASGH